MASTGSVRRLDLHADGLRLAAELYMPEGDGPHPGLILCHGVPAKRVPDPNDRGYPLLAERFSGHGFAVLIFNFRGAGESEGNLDLLGWTHDLEAATDYMCRLDDVDASRLSAMGFSGGAAVTVYRAAKDSRIRSVVACACPYRFFSIAEFSRVEEFLQHCRDVGTIRDPDFPPSVEEWVKGFEEINPIDCVQDISPRPVLFVHGANDETVDPGHARMLYDKAREPKDIRIIEGGDHRLRLCEPAMTAALEWLGRTNGLAGES
jgi:dipeptidyl aminopeptidase/acylaminoacyl peptidase